METYTDDAGYAAIETAKRISQTARMTAIVRLYAIAMIFYRGPVGDRACIELESLIGKDETNALFFLGGFQVGALNNMDRWAELACMDAHESQNGQRKNL